MADGGDGLAGGAADPAGLPRAPASTRSARARGTTWWRAACPRERIRVIHPGVDCVRYSPRPGGRPRPRSPTFLYVGTAEALQGSGPRDPGAGAGPRQRRPDLRARHRGRRRRPAAARAAGPASSGQADAVRFLGFVTEEEKLRLLPQRVGQRVSVAQGRVGYHRRRGGGLRHAVARLRQSGPARLGARTARPDSWCRTATSAALAHAVLELAGDPRPGGPARRARRGRFAERLTWDARRRPDRGAPAGPHRRHVDFR